MCTTLFLAYICLILTYTNATVFQWRNDITTLNSSFNFVNFDVNFTVAATANGLFSRKELHTGQFVTNVYGIYAGERIFGSTPCFNLASGRLSLQNYLNAVKFDINGTIMQLSQMGVAIRVIKYENADKTNSTITYRVGIVSTSALYPPLLELEMMNISSTSVTAAGDPLVCTKLRTQRNWDDSYSWMISNGPGLPLSTTIDSPSSADEVVFTSSAGVVIIEGRNVSVASLTTIPAGEIDAPTEGNGVTVVSYTSTCPPGWSHDPTRTTSAKCYKLFTDNVDYHAAEKMCQQGNGGYGSGVVDAHLASVRTKGEMQIVKRLCRGYRGTNAYDKGCWIGLRDRRKTNEFSWEENSLGLSNAYNTSAFRNWRRPFGENKNFTLEEGELVVSEGQACVYVIPWSEDPLHEEQGMWARSGCTENIKRPLICQVFAATERFTLSIEGSSSAIEATSFHSATDLEFQGGHMKIFSQSSVISLLTLSESATLTVVSSAMDVHVHQLYLESGSELHVDQGVQLYLTPHNVSMPWKDVNYLMTALNSTYFTPEVLAISDSHTLSYIGERDRSTGLLQPRVVLSAGAQIVVNPNPHSTYSNFIEAKTGSSSSTMNVIINAQIVALGTITIGPHSNVRILQTGVLSQSTINASTETSSLYLDGYSSVLSSYDAFDLTLSHRGDVKGEYHGRSSSSFIRADEDDLPLIGVYRLQIAQSPDVDAPYEKTRCIPYHASALEIENILNNDIGLIRDRGNVSVRQYGNRTQAAFGFGYTHRIELDSPSSGDYANGSLSFAINCYGLNSSCGCADTTVPAIDITGTALCPVSADVSNIDMHLCSIPPSIVITRVSTLSHANTVGEGSLWITAGQHRLPPFASVKLIGVEGLGSGIVAADVIKWREFSGRGSGRIMVSGTGWLSWDSVMMLYVYPLYVIERRNANLTDVPRFHMTSEVVDISERAAFLTASPKSNVTWINAQWNGGVIGGQAFLQITQNMTLESPSLKSLKYGMVLWTMPGAKMNWTSGNVSLSNGASIIVEGTINIDSQSNKVFIGQAELIESPDEEDTKVLVPEADIVWNAYYDDSLVQSQRGGWYINPICGHFCLELSFIQIRLAGAVVCQDNANVTFVSPLNMIDVSTITVGLTSDVELFTGGICGNSVVMNIGTGTNIFLSGGSLQMMATCTIRGSGELMVTGGVHDLGLSIDAHITIRDGSMRWPLTREEGITIKFNGGLLMEVVGVLDIQPWSTTVIVYGLMELKDECIIKFPSIGISAQPSAADRQDAPDESPRGNMTSANVMIWEGGTLMGKADFFASDQLYLQGATKHIESLAKLVNQGHAEWSSGDMITANAAAFVNFGTLQVAEDLTIDPDAEVSEVEVINEVNNMYEGTVIPKATGGDMFAKDFHNWDSDFGHLEYAEYISLRTQFVSRAPEGWTPGMEGTRA